MTDLAGIDFSGSMRDAQKGLILKPILHNYLFDAKFPEFDVHFPAEEMERRPDGWFHPSTHPLWSAASLYHYLVNPGVMVIEKKDYMGALSVTVGKAMHSFVQMCLEDAKIMPKALQVCTVCPLEAHKDGMEPGVLDEEAGERGHMDGVLDFSRLSVPVLLEQPIFEFKTSNHMKLNKLEDLDLATYMKKWPEYYAQNQSYMRISGRRFVVVLILGMGYPWTMVEIHVPYDPKYANDVRQKYLDVRQAVADQRPPHCCGALKSCPARRACAALAKKAESAPTTRMMAL